MVEEHVMSGILLRGAEPVVRAVSVLMLGVLAGACPGSGPGPDESEDIPFGIGAKADGLCPVDAELCWPEREELAMRRAMEAQDALLSGAGDPGERALQVVAGLRDLSVKLTEEELGRLPALEARASALAGLDPESRGDDDPVLVFLDEAGRAGFTRLSGLYLAAHAVPMGSYVEGEVEGKGDELSGEQGTAPLSANQSISEGLDRLREGGLFGRAYAFLLEVTGVLDDPPSPLQGDILGGPSREERALEIRSRYRWAAARASLMGAAESLIPVAGFWISVSHGVFLDFRNRARQAMEIAALYGVDVREPDNLLLVAGVTSQAMDHRDVLEAMATSLALRTLGQAAVRAGVGVSVEALIRELLHAGVLFMLDGLAAGGRDALARLASQGLEHKVGSHLLALATFGLSTLVDGATRAYVLARSARDAEVFFRPWAQDAMEASAQYLSSDRGLVCAAELLGRLIYADGRVEDREVEFLAAHLLRWHRVDGRWVQSNASERESLAAWAAKAGNPLEADSAALDIEGCIDDIFRGLDPLERLTILADILLVAMVDRDFSAEESRLYQWYVERLTDGMGAANFDLPEDHLAFLERHLAVTLLDQETQDDAAAASQMAGLSVEQRLPYLSSVPPQDLELVACALGSLSCDARGN